MDLAILIILIVIVIIMFKDVKWVAYLLGIVEMFLRLIHYVGDNLPLPELNNLINAYLPTSTFSILAKYTSGYVYIILSWILVIGLWMFLYYNFCYFINKR